MFFSKRSNVENDLVLFSQDGQSVLPIDYDARLERKNEELIEKNKRLLSALKRVIDVTCEPAIIDTGLAASQLREVRNHAARILKEEQQK